MTVNVGIFGGAFDPPHLGHKRCIDWAFSSGVRMDRVFVIPSGVRVDKPEQTLYQHRLAMCQLAFSPSGVGNVLVGTWESPEKRKGPCYTYDTVKQLTTLYPWWSFHLIVGSDYTDINTWHRGADLQRLLAGIIQVPRTVENSTELRKGFKSSWVDDAVFEYATSRSLYPVVVE